MSEHYGNWINPATGQRLSHTSSTVVNTSLGWRPADEMGQPISSYAPQSYGTNTVSHPTYVSVGTGGGHHIPSAFEIFVWRCIKYGFFAAVTCWTILWTSHKARLSIDEHYFPKASVIGTTTTYTSDQLNAFCNLPWNSRKWVYLAGKNIVITGDPKDVTLKADGNITLTGNVIHSSIKTENGILKAVNATDSALTGDDVWINGRIVNTQLYAKGYYVTRGKKYSYYYIKQKAENKGREFHQSR